MSPPAYDLGGVGRLPWYIPPGSREAGLFDLFARSQERPPADDAGAEELLRSTFDLCRLSPAFLAHQFCTIPLGGGGFGPFNQWTPGQMRVYDAAMRSLRAGRPVRIIVLKARREGVSTLCQLLGAWSTGLHQGCNGLIAAHEDDASATLFGMCRRFLDAIPEPFRAGRAEDSKSAIELAAPLGGRVVHRSVKSGGGSARNQGKGRSAALHWLHASEASRWDDPEAFWHGAVQCVEDYAGTMILIESTANGFGWFQEMWAEAAAGWALRLDRASGALSWACESPGASRSDLTPVFLSWLEEPKYSLPFDSDADRAALLADLDPDERALAEGLGATPERLHWRRRTLWGSKFKGDLAAFREEYPATPAEAFRSSGRKVFDLASLDAVERSIRRSSPQATRWRAQDGALVPFGDGEIAIWKEPVPGRSYAMGVDGSYGKPAGDFMCAQVLDTSSLEQMAQVRVRASDSEEFAAMAAALGRRYDEALAVIEINGPGLAVLKAMDRLGYPSFYYRIQADDSTGEPCKAYGWWSSAKSRRWMVAELVGAVRASPSGAGLVLHDLGTVDEMRGWRLVQSPGGQVKEAPSGRDGHDDRITALGLALVGGCLEGGDGGALASRQAGHERPPERSPDPKTLRHDPEVARILAMSAASRKRHYDPVLGADA